MATPFDLASDLLFFPYEHRPELHELQAALLIPEYRFGVSLGAMCMKHFASMLPGICTNRS
jgi:hypothetical protein